MYEVGVLKRHLRADTIGLNCRLKQWHLNHHSQLFLPRPELELQATNDSSPERTDTSILVLKHHEAERLVAVQLLLTRTGHTRNTEPTTAQVCRKALYKKQFYRVEKSFTLQVAIIQRTNGAHRKR